MFRFYTLALFLVFQAAFASAARGSSEPNHIEGIWRIENSYSISVKAGTAKLVLIENPMFPQKLLGNVFYQNIKHKAGNIWTANRMQWRHPIDDVNDGRWIDEGVVELTLSADKKTLTQGKRRFIREASNNLGSSQLARSVSADTIKPGTKSFLAVDYGGLVVEYTLVKTDLGKSTTYIKGKNTTNKLVVEVSFEREGKVIRGDKLYPGESISGPLGDGAFEAVIAYSADGKPETDPDLIKLIKERIRDYVTTQNGSLKSSSKDLSNIGVRG